jgi:hypothetical protein
MDRLYISMHYLGVMSPQGRKFCVVCLTGAIVSLPIIAGFAVAASYPVSGKWTYENANGEGRTPECGQRYMEFAGERRFDTSGGVPDYRNLAVSRSGAEFHMIDEFNTGQVRARVDYTMRLIDNDHIELKLPRDKTVTLRRCG